MKKLIEVVKELHDGLLDGSVVLDKSRAHTPGPWLVRELDEPAGRFEVIGECLTIHFLVYQPSKMEANAHLVAAAPELLEALYEIRAELKAADDSAWYGTEMDRGIRNALKCAYAAIAKATGGVA